MAYRRWKARTTTPTERRFKAGSLGFAPAVGDVKTTAHIGEGTAGTLDMALWTEITGVAAATDVRYGVDRYTGGPHGSLVGCIDSAGVNRGISGTLDDAGAYNSSGIIDTDGVFHAWGIFDAWGGYYAYGTCNSVGDYAAAGIVHTAGTAAATGVMEAGSVYSALALWIEKSDVVSEHFVVIGNDNYVGGVAGEYPTTGSNSGIIETEFVR
jgi:hypothetical protein